MKPRTPRLIGIVTLAGLLSACSTFTTSTPTPRPVPRVAMMHVGTDHVPPSLGTLVGRLAELGWIDSADDAMRTLAGDGTQVDGRMKQLHGEFDGPRLTLIWSNLEPDQVEQQARDFVSQHVDVIVAFEDKSIAAAQAATADPANRIPIVFLHPSDPVRDHLVDSLDRPGGNLTGVFGARDPVAKQLEYYQYIIPSVHRLLTLVDPTDATTPPLLARAKDAAQRLGLELDIRNASTDVELGEVFGALAPGEVDGAFILSPSLRLNHSQRIIELATKANLPVQAHRKEWVAEGGLVLSRSRCCTRGCRRRAVRRQHPEGDTTSRSARRRSSPRGVCVESEESRRAAHRRATRRDHARGRVVPVVRSRTLGRWR